MLSIKVLVKSNKEEIMGDLSTLLNSNITQLVVTVGGFYWLGKKVDEHFAALNKKCEEKKAA